MDRIKFKTTLLKKMASVGLSETQMETCVDKAINHIKMNSPVAPPTKEASIGGALAGTAAAMGSIGKPMLLGALAGPPLAMGAGGLAAGYLGNSVDSDDVEEEKQRQLLGEIRRLRELAKQNLRAKKYRVLREQGAI